MFSTQIALMHRGRLIVGVSSAPAYGELAYGEIGVGAWLNDAPIAVSRIDTLESAALSTGNLKTLATGPRWPAVGRMIGRLSRIRGYGDFLHYHLLASGRIDAVIESDVNILDVGACAVIVEAAGGRFTDLDGRPMALDSTSVLATNGVLHSRRPRRAGCMNPRDLERYLHEHIPLSAAMQVDGPRGHAGAGAPRRAARAQHQSSPHRVRRQRRCGRDTRGLGAAAPAALGARASPGGS